MSETSASRALRRAHWIAFPFVGGLVRRPDGRVAQYVEPHSEDQLYKGKASTAAEISASEARNPGIANASRRARTHLKLRTKKRSIKCRTN